MLTDLINKRNWLIQNPVSQSKTNIIFNTGHCHGCCNSKEVIWKERTLVLVCPCIQSLFPFVYQLMHIWWPSLSHISTYGMGLNKNGGGLLVRSVVHFNKQQSWQCAVKGQLISYIAVIRIHARKPAFAFSRRYRWQANPVEHNACSVFAMRR